MSRRTLIRFPVNRKKERLMKSDTEISNCCGSQKTTSVSVPKSPAHPDHGAQLSRLNRISGQLNGVKRMIEERRYCPDILTQVRAARAALRSVELLILGTHLRHCVAEAAQANVPEVSQAKIEELVALLEQY